MNAFEDDPLAKIFISAAKKAKKGTKLEVVVQELPPVTKSGYQIIAGGPPSAMFFPGYTKGAWKLQRRGDLSEVVESEAGYHVIVLLEKTSAKFVPEGERRAALAERIRIVRGKRRRRALLTELDGSVKVEVPANADALLVKIDVRVDDDSEPGEQP
jgi:hypothetical protein